MGAGQPTPAEVVTVAMGRWGVAAAPKRLATLLGSCVGVVVYGRRLKVGGLAHVVLPDSRGASENPGKYADTAIPGMLAELKGLAGGGLLAGGLTAKLFGGARMFQTSTEVLTIGQANRDAAERILSELGIAVVGRDLGGESGRRIVVDLGSGVVSVKLPTGENYEI